MSSQDGVTRREFVATATGAAVGSLVAGDVAAAVQAKRRYAIVGTGVRAIGMWGRPILRDYADRVEMVGLCDINPLRVEVAKKQMGATCQTFTDFDDMLTKARPDVVMVTTVDAFHSQYLVRAMERGVDVMTEKPMVIDEAQCRAVLDAEKRTGRRIVVTHNYRYAPKHQKIKELLMSGEIGTITSVDFTWFLDTSHGADYFRRWHRLRSKSGSLWVHKASHHFDLINWWIDGEPVVVSALGSLSNYRKAGPFRHTNCRTCPHKAKCPYYWDIAKSPNLVALYNDCESADGYQRDGCVFKDDIDIFDTMNAVVRYSNGVNMSYSVNTFMPIEGYYLAFNGTKGRLEVRDYERQAWDPGEETSMYLVRNFGQRTKVELPRETEGHGGGDQRLRDLIFKKIDAPAHMRLPDSRAGAMSCLTGIAARKSIDEGRPIKIADLVKFS
jgi:predicted dehydrogenase